MLRAARARLGLSAVVYQELLASTGNMQCSSGVNATVPTGPLAATAVRAAAARRAAAGVAAAGRGPPAAAAGLHKPAEHSSSHAWPCRPIPQQQARAAHTAAAHAATAPEAAALSAAAFASALDAGSGLPLTWVSHWRQQEARRQLQQALLHSTRGRQQQRMRQVATLLSSSGSDWPAPQRAAGAAGGSGTAPGPAVTTSSSLDLPPLQQMSELDELTWLASHPPEDEVEAGSGGGSSSSGMHLWSHPHLQQRAAAAAAGGAATSTAGPAGAGGSSEEELEGQVQLRVGDDLLTVRPMWIAVFQPEDGGTAKLFESVTPLLPDLVGRLSADIAPFCTVTGMRFAGLADESADGWHNFFVGLVGNVAAHEDDILWPNQVLHRDRMLFNVRNGWDVAKFLAAPRREDVEQHRENLLRLAAERGYRRGWCWHMLRVRWGESTLKQMGVALPSS